MKIIIALAASLILSGCMSYSATRADGRNCTFSGTGFVGGAVAHATFKECMEAK